MIRFSKGKPWLQLYQEVVDQINSRPLKKLGGRTPAQLNDPFEDVNSRELLEKVEAKDREKSSSIKEDALEEGALVLIDFPKDADLRSYDIQRGEIKKIKEVDQTLKPYTYVLEDLDGERVLPRKCYRRELRRVSKLRNLPHEIEKIFKSRRKNKRKEYLVSFYKSNRKKWIPERDLYKF